MPRQYASAFGRFFYSRSKLFKAFGFNWSKYNNWLDRRKRAGKKKTPLMTTAVMALADPCKMVDPELKAELVRRRARGTGGAYGFPRPPTASYDLYQYPEDDD